MYNKSIYLEDVNMNYYKKVKKPKRDDTEYIEIENFEDYELINNFIYECIIRTEAVKKLGIKYDYCLKKYNDIANFIDLDQYREERLEEVFNNISIANNECTQSEESEISEFKNDSDYAEQVLFEDALQYVKKEQYKILHNEEFKLINEDLKTFKNKNYVPLKKENKDELYELSSNLNIILSEIREVVKNIFYLDTSKQFMEYENSSSSSLYIKREYKETYYIETRVDKDNRTISKTIKYLPKRKLYINDIFEFSSNHLILPVESNKLLETFFKIDKKYIRSSKIIADCFFCYDYYNFRVAQVKNKNDKIVLRNKDNYKIIELQHYIKLEENKGCYKDNTKIKELKKEIDDEKEKKEDRPTLNKRSKYFVFDEEDFKNSDINRSTALRYYQWISPFIKGYNYIDIINFNKIDELNT